jgi:hypothetical protein
MQVTISRWVRQQELEIEIEIEIDPAAIAP